MRRLLPLALLAVAVSGAGSPPAGAVDLEGTWYVLIHYTDSATANPEVTRWLDRIWEFEREGDRLVWRDYPIVVFEDQSGRWEGRKRTLTAWEPNAAQWQEIAAGLQVNQRGSTRKVLFGSDDEGWSSRSPGRRSLGVVSYEQHWSIENVRGLPVFTWRDSLGTAAEDGFDGITRFETEVVEGDGNLLVGRYRRDESKRGTFRMIRAGSATGLRSGGKTPNQKAMERAMQQMLSPSGPVAEDLRERILEALASYHVDPRAVDLDALVGRALERARSGADEEAIGRLLGDEIAAAVRARFESRAHLIPPPQPPDPAVRYAFPFPPDPPRELIQGVDGRFSHQGPNRFAFDFALPPGTPVLAAREGTVIEVIDGFDEGGPSPRFRGRANTVLVAHADGTWAVYAHLARGIPVKVGDRVERGQEIGRSGRSGYVAAPHLHFAVWARSSGEEKAATVPVRFEGGPEGLVPEEGRRYPPPGSP